MENTQKYDTTNNLLLRILNVFQLKFFTFQDKFGTSYNKYEIRIFTETSYNDF